MIIIIIIRSFLFLLDIRFINWFLIFSIYFIIMNLPSNLNNLSIKAIWLRDHNRILLIFLNLWIFFIIMKIIKKKSLKIIWFIFLLIWISFIVNRIFNFFFLFEIIFFIIFLYLIINGKTIKRIQASLYIFFFTFIFSLPLLIIIITIFYLSNSQNFSILSYIQINNSFLNKIIIVFIIIVFLVKLPIYIFHIWLPKAHVEAPLEGSIILAGVLLKLGGYGVIRFSFLTKNFFKITSNLSNILVFTAILGSLIISLVCLRQSDIKSIIAYSSVVHIRIILIGIISFSRIQGNQGRLIIIIAHGFISPLIFFSVDYIYNKINSRRIFIIKSINYKISKFYIIWIFCLILNIRFPIFISFFSEVIVIASLSNNNMILIFILIITLFFSAAYNIFLFIFCCHGKSIIKKSIKINSLFILYYSLIIYFVLVYPIFILWYFSFNKY